MADVYADHAPAEMAFCAYSRGTGLGCHTEFPTIIERQFYEWCITDVSFYIRRKMILCAPHAIHCDHFREGEFGRNRRRNWILRFSLDRKAPKEL